MSKTYEYKIVLVMEELGTEGEYISAVSLVLPNGGVETYNNLRMSQTHDSRTGIVSTDIHLEGFPWRALGLKVP